MTSKIPLAWSEGRTDKEIEAIRFFLENQSAGIQAFLDILTRMEKEEDRAEMDSKYYDSPAWAYKQADKNGARRAMRRVRDLFTTKA